MTPRPSTPHFRVRILLVALAILLGLAVLVTQLVRWQVLQRSDFAPSTSMKDGSVALASGQVRGQDRGAITDINGVPLAFDTYQWEIWIEPRLTPKGKEQELASELVELLGPSLRLTPDELLSTLQAREPGVVTLTRQGSQAAGETIAGWQRLDIGAKALPVRIYPQGTLAAHLLGFVNGEPRAYYGVGGGMEVADAQDAPATLAEWLQREHRETVLRQFRQTVSNAVDQVIQRLGALP